MLHSRCTITRVATACSRGAYRLHSNRIPKPVWSIDDLKLYESHAQEVVSIGDLEKLASLSGINANLAVSSKQAIARDVNIILRCAQQMKKNLELSNCDPVVGSINAAATSELREDVEEGYSGSKRFPANNSKQIDGYFVSPKVV